MPAHSGFHILHALCAPEWCVFHHFTVCTCVCLFRVFVVVVFGSNYAAEVNWRCGKRTLACLLPFRADFLQRACLKHRNSCVKLVFFLQISCTFINEKINKKNSLDTHTWMKVKGERPIAGAGCKRDSTVRLYGPGPILLLAFSCPAGQLAWSMVFFYFTCLFRTLTLFYPICLHYCAGRERERFGGWSEGS